MNYHGLPGESPAVGNGVIELSAEQPGRELVHLHLAQRKVGLPVEHGGVVGAVDGLVVAGWKITEHIALASLSFCNN